MADIYDVHPPTARWTHVALRVSDIEASIAWYIEHTPLRLIDKRSDEMGHGAWLGHDDTPDSPFVLVLAEFFEETDPFSGTAKATLAPFAHLGIELTSRAAVDESADIARDLGFLAMEPRDLGPPIGYICMVTDPDGNMIEFSYDQGVYATAQSRMR